MSVQYDVGFRRKPKVDGLDGFMQSLGFVIEPANQRSGEITRVNVLCNESIPREIEFFYNKNPRGHKSFFGKREKEVKACGALKTYSCEPAHPDPEDRKRIIETGIVKTERDYYKHLDNERHKFYETALAIRDHFNALLYCDGRVIDPNRPFPFKR